MEKNVSGTMGFWFSILAFVFGWVPYLGGIFWVIGAILSAVGLSNPHRHGLAVAGFVISTLWFLAWLALGFTISTFEAFTLWPYFLW